MRWHLGRRELVVFAALIVLLELTYLLGDSEPFWFVIGVVAPVAVLLASNMNVGVVRRSREPTQES